MSTDPFAPPTDRCPRCNNKTLMVRRETAEMACSGSKCSWPDPEPGLINVIRLRHGAAADSMLQSMRAAGYWPPVP